MPRKDIWKDAKPFTKDDPRINRKGRPRLPDLPDTIAKILSEQGTGKDDALSEIFKKIVELALKGNLKAAEILLDRAYGRPTQPIESDNHLTIEVSRDVIE
jgi:hypothetical protein